MTPEEIGKETSRVSLTRGDIDTLRDWALEKGDLARAIGFAGLGALMDATPVAGEAAEEVMSEEVNIQDATNHSGNRVVDAFRSGLRRVRGSRRPEEYQDHDKYTYGSNTKFLRRG